MCKQKIASFSLQLLAEYPLKEETWGPSVHGLTEKHRPTDRSAFIFEHGSWNAYQANATMGWLAQMEAHWSQAAPWFLPSPRLFLSPPANGENKHPWLIENGNNIRVQLFAHAIDSYVKSKGYDHIAFYNLTVQATSFDGTVSAGVSSFCTPTYLQALMSYAPADSDMAAYKLGIKHHRSHDDLQLAGQRVEKDQEKCHVRYQRLEYKLALYVYISTTLCLMYVCTLQPVILQTRGSSFPFLLSFVI